MTDSLPSETKAEAEALISKFVFERVLHQDQNGRRTNILGTISSQPALLTLERAAFPSNPQSLTTILSSLNNLTNLGANDIYRWYLSNLTPTTVPTTTSSSSSPTPDLKINLIYPCTPRHISKYSPQRLHFVTETPSIYASHIHPYILSQRTSGRLDWIFNILDGRTEQEDVILRSAWDTDDGFLLLPDLNWDRKSIQGLHLLALVQRRDIWSLRDLKKKHVPWLRNLQAQVKKATARSVSEMREDEEEMVEEDELKCYVHYHPTYYHFHVHVVHVMGEAEGGTQSVGKAWELGGLVGWLESMDGGEERGLDGVEMGYGVGEESELWKGLWGRLKKGDDVTLNA